MFKSPIDWSDDYLSDRNNLRFKILCLPIFALSEVPTGIQNVTAVRIHNNNPGPTKVNK